MFLEKKEFIIFVRDFIVETKKSNGIVGKEALMQ